MVVPRKSLAAKDSNKEALNEAIIALQGILVLQIK